MERAKFVAEGVIPATLLAFNEDMSIDERSTRAHIRDVADVRGVTGIVVNGHASEVHACTFDEQKRILDMAVDEVGARVPLIAGVYAEGGIEAGRIARMAHDAGAAAMLVFPSQSLWMGAMARPEMAISHFQAVVDQTDLPLVLFQYATNSPLFYPLPVLEALLDRFPQIVGIKDFSNDAQLHDYHTRVLQARERPVSVFTSHSAWLLGSLVMGAKGIISGAGSVIAAYQVELFEAVQRNDLAAAREVADRIYATTRAFYVHPAVDMHNRMKEALVHLGKLDRAVVRPPLQKLGEEEIAHIRRSLVTARLLD